MPIYEYICQDCERHFEAIVSGERKAECPDCKSKKLEQQLSAFAVGAPKGKGRFGKSAPNAGPCGNCGDPRGPGSCSMN